MSGSVTTMNHGLPALDTGVLKKIIKTDSVCSHHNLHILPRGFHGNTPDPIAGTSWTSSLPDVPLSTVCSTHAAFTVRTVTLTTHCYAARTSEDGVYIHTRSDGKFFNLARLKAKSKISKVLIRELLFADDVELTSLSADSLQRLIDRFADA